MIVSLSQAYLCTWAFLSCQVATFRIPICLHKTNMVLSELSLFSPLKLPGGEVRRWKYSSCGSSGGGVTASGQCTSNFRMHFHYNNSSSSSATTKHGMSKSTMMMSCSTSSSCVARVGRGLVESTPILKVMELLGSLRWIFLLILLTDSGK